MRILLVAPPYRTPNEGTLAIAMLRPLFEAHGVAVDELHGSLCYTAPGTDGNLELYDWNSRWAFCHSISPLPVEPYIDQAMRHMVATLDPCGLVCREDDPQSWSQVLFGMDEESMRADLRAKIGHAEACLDRIIERALAGGPYDFIGFSTIFIEQIPAGVAVARRLKSIWPQVPIAFGGAACQSEHADGLLATCPEIDLVCHTEAEDVIPALVGAIAGRLPLAEVPGISWRDGSALKKNPAPPLYRDLDRCPIPDYRAFVKDLAASDWTGRGADLFFETSRGCWWGEKFLCTFCGLNGEGLPFRSKSPDRAYREIAALHDGYPTANTLRAADNIVDHRYIKTLLPKLVSRAQDPVRPLRMFFEIKSNLRADQVEALVAGGITHVQPGIESFSDGVLALMRKGTTGPGQIQFIKWSQEAGLMISYNVLVMNPGERPEWYDEMVELLPFIRHLTPPSSVATVLLERFSPYFIHPESFGITDLRPKPFHHAVFGAHADPRLAYEFAYDHPMLTDERHLTAARALAAGLRAWQAAWRPDMAYYIDQGERLLIVDAREGDEVRSFIAGESARIYHFLDQTRTRKMLTNAFPAVEPAVLDALLEVWLHRRWICKHNGHYLAVLPRQGPRRAGKRSPPARAEPMRLELVQ